MNLSNGTSRGIEEARQYGHQIASARFYALGTTVSGSTAVNYKFNPDQLANVNDIGTNVGNMLTSATVDHYDANSRVEQKQNFGHIYSWDDTGGEMVPPVLRPLFWKRASIAEHCRVRDTP